MLTLAKSFSSIRDASSKSSRHSASSSTTTFTPSPPKLRPSSSFGALDNLVLGVNGDVDADVQADENNATLKMRPKSMAFGEVERSEQELQLLAISAQITEVCYSISDIQTRIFEIQEMRHQSTSAPTSSFSSTSGSPTSSSAPAEPDAAAASASIDRALMALDERLESVSISIRAIDDALEPFLHSAHSELTPTQASAFEPLPGESGQRTKGADVALVLRKHDDLRVQWEEVHAASEELKEELREDKWLAVFRTVSQQADDMMGSLEKAVSTCHDFIWQAGRMDDPNLTLHSNSSASLLSPNRVSVNLEVFQGILQAYESKKKYYVPATTKVISVIDKGMRDRATKNGECLRRHAELRARWRNLRERMGRIDGEMEGVRLMLSHRENQTLVESSDDEGSLVSRQTARSKLSTSMLSTGSVASSRERRDPSSTNASALSRSISPFRRLAAKMGGWGSNPPSASKSPGSGSDGSPPVLRKRSSYFSLRSSMAGTPEPRGKGPRLTAPLGRSTPLPIGSGTGDAQPRWNSSTKVQYVDPKPDMGPPTPRGTPSKARRPSISHPTPLQPQHPQAQTTPTPSRRLSSMGQVRPPSRIVSGPAAFGSGSTNGQPPPVPPLPSNVHANPPTTPTRPGHGHGHGRPSTPTRTPSSHAKKRSVSSSRNATPPPPVPPLPASALLNNRATTPGLQQTPRPRPSSPSSIPVPAFTPSRANTPMHHFFGGDPGDDPDNPPTSLMQRALSPTFSTISSSAGGLRSSTRRLSSSRIPIPTFQITDQPPSPEPSPSTGRPSLSPGSVGSSIIRPQTPESTLKARAGQMPFYQTLTASSRPSTGAAGRPVLKAPPSSFRDGASQSQSGRTTPSASGRATPSRPSSRVSAAAAFERMFSPSLDKDPVPLYVPIGPNDPLEIEVARAVNGLAHGFLVERVDPIPKTAPPGGEYKAQYAVSNSLGRKVITCRLVVMSRSTGRGGVQKESRKVMVRVGGGWQDLDIYLLNRQAGVF